VGLFGSEIDGEHVRLLCNECGTVAATITREQLEAGFVSEALRFAEVTTAQRRFSSVDAFIFPSVAVASQSSARSSNAPSGRYTGQRVTEPTKLSGIIVWREPTMNKLLPTGAIMTALALSAIAQDWYHEREERFRGEQWRPHIFMHVRTDLEHVWSGRAADRERERLQKTEEELTKMQTDLDQGRWDNGLLNDVIDSIRKSSNDDRLASRDRDILADDLRRLKEFQDQHNRRR